MIKQVAVELISQAIHLREEGMDLSVKFNPQFNSLELEFYEKGWNPEKSPDLQEHLRFGTGGEFESEKDRSRYENFKNVIFQLT